MKLPTITWVLEVKAEGYDREGIVYWQGFVFFCLFFGGHNSILPVPFVPENLGKESSPLCTHAQAPVLLMTLW